MRMNRRSKFGVLVMLLTLGGCASFEPGLRFQDLLKPRQPTAKEVLAGVEVSVEEFATPKKSQMVFDTDLIAQRVLPLLVRIENKAEGNYKIEKNRIRAFLEGQSLTPLSATEAANQAVTSEYAGKALAWTAAMGPFGMILWPATIGVSARHTHGVNQRIVQHFEGTQLPDASVKPSQTTAGFVYFKLSDEAKKLENLVIEVETSEEQSGKVLSYKFPLPPIGLNE